LPQPLSAICVHREQWLSDPVSTWCGCYKLLYGSRGRPALKGRQRRIHRYFDADTLSVRVYQYASDERLGAALIPAALILALGLIASLALVPGLERRSRNAAPDIEAREASTAGGE